MTGASFGDWLKRQRGAVGLTQKQLAQQLNCSLSMIRKMEYEERRPSAALVNSLADLFAIPIEKRETFHNFARGDSQAMQTGIQKEKSTHVSFEILTTLANDDSDGKLNRLLQFAAETQNQVEKISSFRQVLKLAKSLGNTRKQLEALWQLGWLDQANRFIHWEKAVSLARTLGDDLDLANILSTIGLFLVLDGDLSSAEKYLSESTAIHERLQLPSISSPLLLAYGQISLMQGDYEKARTYFHENANLSLASGTRLDFLWSQVRLAYLSLHEGNLKDTFDLFSKTAREFQVGKSIIGVVYTLEGMGGLYTKLENPKRAAQLIGWADSTRKKISDIRPLMEQKDIDNVILACIEMMGASAFSDAYMEGQRKTLDEAIGLALDKS